MAFAVYAYGAGAWAATPSFVVVVPPVDPPPVDPGPDRDPPITGLRIMTPIPAFPQYPSRADPPEEFMVEGDAFLAHFPTFQTAANTLSTEMDAAAAATALNEAYATDAAVAAAASANVASGVANYKGPWSSLAGALAIPASVSHSGKIWTLTENVANVAAETPGVSAKWVLPYPIRRLNLFETAATALRAVSSGEQVFASFAVLDLASSAFVATCGTGGFVVSSSAAASTVRTSTDNGATYTSRALPASSTWRVLGFSARFLAFAEGQTGANAMATSDDNGVTWVAQNFGNSLGSAASTRYAADAGGSFGIVPASTATTIHRSLDSGATWSVAQTAPVASPTSTHIVGGVAFMKAAGQTYHTSTTGLTGSWTSRTLPGTCDTIVMTEGDGVLLAYKAGSPTETVYMLSDFTTFVWQPLPQALWAPSASVRVAGLSSLLTATGSPMECAAAFVTGADLRWVPRSAPFAIGTSKHVARNGNSTVVVANNAAYRLPYAAGAAPLGLWE